MGTFKTHMYKHAQRVDKRFSHRNMCKAVVDVLLSVYLHLFKVLLHHVHVTLEDGYEFH